MSVDVVLLYCLLCIHSNNPIAGEIISLPEIHHVNRDSSSELVIHELL